VSTYAAGQGNEGSPLSRLLQRIVTGSVAGAASIGLLVSSLPAGATPFPALAQSAVTETALPRPQLAGGASDNEYSLLLPPSMVLSGLRNALNAQGTAGQSAEDAFSTGTYSEQRSEELSQVGSEVEDALLEATRQLDSRLESAFGAFSNIMPQLPSTAVSAEVWNILA
jgi:hypothetical protein